MRRPFGKLMDMLDQDHLPPETTMGDLSEKYGESIERIMDALDALKERRGQASYLPRYKGEE